jgi:two-component system, OmpR family, sensor histidine kinase KdpD
VARGSLRIYLGAAPGVGKTFAMLGEGNRRHDRGADVVIGIVETHGRAATGAEVGDLEVIPRRRVAYRDTALEEMDVDAVIARQPEVVLVDEFAHTNVPGSRNEKRWQDVEELLDAGIDVVSTLNIQHLESLNDVIFRITGTTQRETVPDAVVRRAEQIELVDMTPEAVRRRMAHGNIYPAERIDAALANYFRPGNLGALRELALLWVADRVEESLQDYLAEQGINEAWETRERVVVAITGAPSGDGLIRRAARMASRARGELVGVHVASGDGLTVGQSSDLDRQRRLVEELGGVYREMVGHEPAATLVAFARAEKATQLVLGASKRSRWQEVLRGSIVNRVVRTAGTIDVHVIAVGPDEQADRPRREKIRRTVDPRRQLAAWLLTVGGLPAIVAVLVSLSDQLSLSTDLLLLLSFVIGIAALGGRLVSFVAAVAASLLANWYFVEPLHTLTIAGGENIVALIVFVVVAAVIGTLVDRAARRASEARRSRAEAEALARSSASLATDPHPLPGLVDQLRTTFGFDAVEIARVHGGRRTVIAGSGQVGGEAIATSTELALAGGGPDDRHVLLVTGRPLTTDDQRLLRVLADQIAIAIEAERLTADAAEASLLTEVDAVRTALLRAVSHDLRTPLATIKAMISGLRDTDVDWTPGEMAEAFATVDEETDRLNRLVGNLLDASRLQSGALAVSIRPTALEEPVSAAIHSVGQSGESVAVSLPDDLPLVQADAALLERSLANVLANALRHSPPDQPVRLEAGVVGADVHLRIVDRGPGIPSRQRARVVAPFQRLGDQRTDDGVGLGLAIAVGFVEAMDGTLTLDDTPGGGLTVTIVLHRATPGGEVAA